MSRRSSLCVAALLFVANVAIAAESAPKPQAPAPESKAPAPDPGLRLILPPVLYAVPGVEMNVYFDNVVLVVNPANYVFDVTCARGVQQAERWTFKPTAKDVGDHAFLLEVRDQANRVLASAEATLHVAPAEAGAGKAITMLIIGDSLTAASAYPARLIELFKTEGNPELTLIGSYGPGGKPGENRHEGYGGWTAHRFATHYTGVAREGDRRKRGSPFIYKDGDAKPKLDFARYCREFNNGAGPDFVTILLGCNDTFSSTDETIEQRIDTMFEHYETLVKMIHGVRADTQIGALLLVPPAATQDAFGANYKCGQTRWQYKRNQHRVVERMMKQFAAREAQHLHLLPAHVNLDCVHNYPMRRAPWNAHATEKGARLSNGVHPATAGYRQIGDTIYSWLKARLAAGGR